MDDLTSFDMELIEETISDLIHMPACMREAAVKDFEAIDPEMGRVLRLELALLL